MNDRFFRIYTVRSGQSGDRRPRPGSLLRILFGLALLTVFLFLMLALGWIFLLAGILLGLPWMVRTWWSTRRSSSEGQSRTVSIDGEWRPLDPPVKLAGPKEPAEGRDRLP